MVPPHLGYLFKLDVNISHRRRSHTLIQVLLFSARTAHTFDVFVPAFTYTQLVSIRFWRRSPTRHDLPLLEAAVAAAQAGLVDVSLCTVRSSEL